MMPGLFAFRPRAGLVACVERSETPATAIGRGADVLQRIEQKKTFSCVFRRERNDFLIFRAVLRPKRNSFYLLAPDARAKGVSMLPSIEPEPGPRLTFHMWALIAAFVVIVLILAGTWSGPS